MTSHVMSCPLIARWTPIQFPPFQSVLYWAASTATQYHIPGGKAIPIPEQAGLSPNSPFHPQSGARPRSGRAGQPSPSLALCFLRLLGRRPGPFLSEIVGCETGLAFYYRVGVSLGGHDARLCKWGLENRTMTVQVLL